MRQYNKQQNTDDDQNYHTGDHRQSKPLRKTWLNGAKNDINSFD